MFFVLIWMEKVFYWMLSMNVVFFDIFLIDVVLGYCLLEWVGM